ncbi:MAG: IclR family transcriptional regulator [Christensenellales bacterium]|jgi:DNA-binding IclR family transcriptional regulator
MSENQGYKNLSTIKVLNLIELLADVNKPMRLMDIAKGLKANPSTTLRFLSALVESGYAAQEPETSRYYLTFKICSIANKISSNVNLRDIAQPYLSKVSALMGESACLALENDMRVVYIDVIEGPDQMIRSMQRIGSIAPLHCTGIGKLFLLNYSDEKLDRYIAQKGLTRFTQNTIVSKEELVDELVSVRQRGHAFDNEECEIGARCIAFPVHGRDGKISAGISITGPVGRLTDELIEKNLAFLEESAKNISAIYSSI